VGKLIKTFMSILLSNFIGLDFYSGRERGRVRLIEEFNFKSEFSKSYVAVFAAVSAHEKASERVETLKWAREINLQHIL
jgi:hypothetical protein